MYAFNILVALLPFFGLFAYAVPVDGQVQSHNVNTTISKRDLPMFVGFGSDPDRRARVETAFRDAVRMAQLITQTTSSLDPAFKNYFRAEDKENVLNVLRNIVGQNLDGTGSPSIGGLVADNTDQFNGCPASPRILAFVENLMGTDKGSITICDRAYTYPDLSDIQCDNLGSTVSTSMSSLAGIVLHELTHFSPIGYQAIGLDIIDHDDPGYGPYNVRTLLASDSRKALLNADNYRWYVQEYYWTKTCGRTFAAPRNNIDTADSACGGSTCIIM